MKKRIFSRVLALFMALSLLSTTAFAASFTDLQNAIDGTEGTGVDIGEGRYGYGGVIEGTEGQYAIEAWDGTRTETEYDENGNVTQIIEDVATRHVKLNEDVNYSETDTSGIRMGQYLYGENHAYDVTLDLNGHDIDLNPGAVLDADTGKFYKAERDAEGNKVATEELVDTSTLNNGSVIQISHLYDNSYNLTINDSSANGDGSITGGYNSNNNGGGIYGGRGNITLNGGNIAGNYSGVYGGGVNGTLVMNGGSISGNYSRSAGGGVAAGGHSIMNGGKISGNTSATYMGGGVMVHSQFIMKNGEISGNHAVHGGGVAVNTKKCWFVMDGGSISGNNATNADGLFVLNSNFEMNGGAIAENGGANGVNVFVKSNNDASSQMTRTGGTISGGVTCFTDKAGNGSNAFVMNDVTCVLTAVRADEGDKQIVTITVQDAEGNQIGEKAVSTLLDIGTRFKVSATNSSALRIELSEESLDTALVTTFGFGGYVDNTGFHPYETDPNLIPKDDTGDIVIIPDASTLFVDAADDTSTIDDQAVPLAGLVSLAELLEALRQYEGIEDVELPEDFQWIDHEYAQAIYWGLDEALVENTEDDPLDPDEIVTVAILREVLENFVEYKGVDLIVIVEGEEDDEIVFDLGERLTAFYAELEAALADKAA